MTLELYAIDLSPFTRPVELLLTIKGADFRRIVPDRDMILGKEFGRLNPMRKIPLLVVDGVPVCESQVIAELVEELYPAPPLLPEAPLDRAQARMLATLTSLYIATPGVKMFSNQREGGGADIEADAKALLARGLDALEQVIAPGLYALGETRSLADCMLAPALFFVGEMLGSLGFKDVPELGPKTRRYFNAIGGDADIAQCLASMRACSEEWLATVG